MAEQRNESQNVRDIMTPNPRCVTEKDSVLEVARIMRDQDTGVIPVVDGRKIIGLVTDRDIVLRAVAGGKDINGCHVNEVMTRQVRSVSEDASVREVLDVMSNAQIRRVPVVNRNNELVGIVSMKDLATETGATDKVGKAVEEISEGPSNN
ncbi:MAG TPA: CBS domain-containing protein [Thermoanaerobaculia bacterium]|nr:CBS domain-containing protein [Thermoanaerobaculia bacterium]